MTDWKLISVTIGIFGALLGVYFREALRKAERQKIVAIKLEAYLNDIIGDLLEGEMKELFLLGAAFQEKRSLAVQDGGKGAILKSDKEYEEMLEKIKAYIDEGGNELKEGLKKQFEFYHKMSAPIFDHALKQLEIVSDNLFSDIGFISDEEAALLSWSAAQRVVKFRNIVQKTIALNISTMHILRQTEKFDYDSMKDLFYETTIKLIELSKHINPLKKHAESINKQSVLLLTVKNMMGVA